jgi:RNA polymerase sigma factor (sigma-70 family)
MVSYNLSALFSNLCHLPNTRRNPGRISYTVCHSFWSRLTPRKQQYAIMPPDQQENVKSSPVPADAATDQVAEPSRWEDFPHSLESIKKEDTAAWRDLIRKLNIIADAVISKNFRGGEAGLKTEDAQDLAANLYREVHQQIGRFRSLDSIEAWFRFALDRDAKDLKKKLKAKKRDRDKTVSLDAQKAEADSTREGQTRQDYSYMGALHTVDDSNYNWEIDLFNNPELAVQRDDLRHVLMDYVDQLEPADKKFIKCELRGLKHREIAAECRCGTGEVGIRLQRIHAKLTQKMNADGITAGED